MEKLIQELEDNYKIFLTYPFIQRDTKELLPYLKYLTELSSYVELKLLDTLEKIGITEPTLHETTMADKLNVAYNFFNDTGLDIDIENAVANDDIIMHEARDGQEFLDDDEVDRLAGYVDFIDGRWKVFVLNRNIYEEVSTLVHELEHYVNRGNFEITPPVAAVTTEALAFSVEIILSDYLKQNGEIEVGKNCFFETIQNMFNNMYHSYYFIQLLRLYKEKGNLNIETYEEFYNFTFEYEEEYEDILEQAIEYLDGDKGIWGLWYAFAYPIVIHIYHGYKKDPKKWIAKINKLHTMINISSLEEVLTFMEIKIPLSPLNFNEDLDILVDELQEYINPPKVLKGGKKNGIKS